MGANIERNLERMVELIVKRFAPRKIILFGSHATGRARGEPIATWICSSS